MKTRYKQIAACYLILRKRDKILLLKRYNTGFMDGKYGLVAGHVEKNETARNCVVREAKEEVGILIQPENLRLAHLMHRQEYENPGERRFCLFWLADKWSGELNIIEKDKCNGLKWFPIDKLPTNLIPYVRQAIRLSNQQAFYSEFDWSR